MKKLFVVKNNYEFSNIIKNGFKIRTELFSFYVLDNNLTYNRYGISISKKIGNAVVRNTIKRQIRDIIDNVKSSYNGKDVILIGRSYLKNSNYLSMKDSFINFNNIMGEKCEK